VKGRVALQISLIYTKNKGDLAYLYLFVENLKNIQIGDVEVIVKYVSTKFADYQWQLVGMIFLRVFMEFLGDAEIFYSWILSLVHNFQVQSICKLQLFPSNGSIHANKFNVTIYSLPIHI